MISRRRRRKRLRITAVPSDRASANATRTLRAAGSTRATHQRGPTSTRRPWARRRANSPRPRRELRRTDARDPSHGEPSGSPDRRGCSCDAEIHASWPGAGCWVGTSASPMLLDLKQLVRWPRRVRVAPRANAHRMGAGYRSQDADRSRIRVACSCPQPSALYTRRPEAIHCAPHSSWSSQRAAWYARLDCRLASGATVFRLGTRRGRRPQVVDISVDVVGRNRGKCW
jgi:hypothetical protein